MGEDLMEVFVGAVNLNGVVMELFVFQRGLLLNIRVEDLLLHWLGVVTVDTVGLCFCVLLETAVYAVPLLLLLLSGHIVSALLPLLADKLVYSMIGCECFMAHFEVLFVVFDSFVDELQFVLCVGRALDILEIDKGWRSGIILGKASIKRVSIMRLIIVRRI
jgi:hypothetical protein